MPVPTGPAAAEPADGAFGLLLWSNRLWVSTQQDGAPATGGLTPAGQAPFCGEGSSPFWLLVSNPSSLLSKREFSISIQPPEFDPEYPSALYSPQTLSIVWWQTCWHAPM